MKDSISIIRNHVIHALPKMLEQTIHLIVITIKTSIFYFLVSYNAEVSLQTT